MLSKLITQEGFTSVQEVQKGVTKVFAKAAKKGNFLRVMRNQKPLGVLIPNQVWEDLLEDIEALSSPNFLHRTKTSRESKKRYSAAEIKKMYKLE